MSDLLAIGTAGVRAMQAALAQVGDNVANADTPGYVRRSLRLATGPSSAGTLLSRDTGGTLLATRGLGIAPGRANAGSAAVDVRVSDDRLLSPGGYRLLRDASDWRMAQRRALLLPDRARSPHRAAA
jgi:flagellar hook-associated protein 1